MISLNNLLNGFSAPNIYREEALQEGAQYSYYDKVMSQEQFDAVCKLDPTPNGKYQKWLLGVFANSYKYVSKAKQDLDNTTQTPENAMALITRKRAYNMLKEQFDKAWFGEDAYKTTETLRLYDYITKKKVYLAELQPGQNQIMTLKTLGDLNQIVKSVTDKHPELIEADDVQLEASNNATKVFDQDGWLIVIPNTEEASCKYGANTRWCTAATGGNNRYKSYTSDNGRQPDNTHPLFIIIDRQNNQKWQFNAKSEQFMDAQDIPISPSTLYDFPKSVLEFLANDEKIEKDSGYGEQVWRAKIIKAVGNYDIARKIYEWVKTEEAHKVLRSGWADSLIWNNQIYLKFKDRHGSDFIDDAHEYFDSLDAFCNADLPEGKELITLKQAKTNVLEKSFDEYPVDIDARELAHINISRLVNEEPTFKDNPISNPAWNEEDEDWSNSEHSYKGIPDEVFEEGWSDEQLQEALWTLEARERDSQIEDSMRAFDRDPPDWYNSVFVAPWANVIEIWWALKGVPEEDSYNMSSTDWWFELETELLPLVYAKVHASETQPQQ